MKMLVYFPDINFLAVSAGFGSLPILVGISTHSIFILWGI